MKDRMLRITAFALILSTCGMAQTTTQAQSAPAQQQPAQDVTPIPPAQSNTNVAPQVQGTKVDPAAGAQQPDNNVQPAQEQTLPNAPAAPKQNTQPQQPVGAATAEGATTHGGVASRPAGVAIAPAKQHQVRSLLLKTGAILAGAAAIGAVYGLHSATPSNPPGATKPAISASK